MINFPGLIKSLIKFMNRLPLGGMFKYASMHIYSVFVASFEGLAAYRDNPIPILNAFYHIVSHQGF